MSQPRSARGASGILGRSLGRTDADRGFKGPIYGALFNFDLRPALFSQRSGLVLFEAQDPAIIRRGFQLFFDALGATKSGSGEQKQYLLFDAFNVSVLERERYAALLMGRFIPGDLPPFVDATPRINTEGHVARFYVNGDKLSAAIAKILDELTPFLGLDEEVIQSTLSIVSALKSSHWNVRFGDESLIIEGVTEIRSPNTQEDGTNTETPPDAH